MRVVILGGNIAGSNAADVIKKENADIEVEIYTEETYFNYTRIKLPSFLCGMVSQEELITCNEKWYKDRNIKYQRESIKIGNVKYLKALPKCVRIFLS